MAVLPTFALVGRPNVGKSTLFNRLTRSRDALVADFPGLTRDRKYGEASVGDRRFLLIDTGGLTGEEAGVEKEMASQAISAIEEADQILFLVDGRAGLNLGDEQIADLLRRQNKPVHLVVNKIDGVQPEIVEGEFHALGFANLSSISASHGRGVNQLINQLLADLPETPQQDEPQTRGIRIAVVGRPNVGKSTLVNRMLGEERVVVFDMPGTTRDSIYIDYERHGEHYTLIDTAGVRRRKNVREGVEKFSIVKTLQAISDAQVVILLMDGSEGIVDQDLHLLGHCMQAGRALVVAVNKWDGLDSYARERIKDELDRRLRFIDYADVHFISALHGSGVGKLYDSVHAAWESASGALGTNRLTRILEDAVQEHAPPMVRGRRIKLRYAHAGGRNPPVIVIHGNQTSAVPDHYTRFLEKTYRRALDLKGTPLRIEYRSSENPFAGRKNKLTDRQIRKRKRLKKHLSKK